jgi:ribosomal protein S18 acetylase RimI-like enzyme
MAVQIIPVSSENVAMLQFLHQKNFKYVYGALTYDDICTTDSPQSAFLAQFEGASIGEITTEFLIDHGYPILHIVSISVLRRYRGSGVGENLLAYVMRACSAACGFFLHVRITNDAARRLYEKMGFEVVARVPAYYRDEDGFYMRAPNWHYSPPGRPRRPRG